MIPCGSRPAPWEGLILETQDRHFPKPHTNSGFCQDQSSYGKTTEMSTGLTDLSDNHAAHSTRASNSKSAPERHSLPFGS